MDTEAEKPTKKPLMEMIDHPDQKSYPGVTVRKYAKKINPDLEVLTLPCGHKKNLSIKIDGQLVNSQDNLCPVKQKYPDRVDVTEDCL